MTAEELMARVEQADARIDEGHYVEHEAAKQHFQSRIAKKQFVFSTFGTQGKIL